jgi:hypothetical protein
LQQHGEEHELLKPFDDDSNLTLDPTEMGKLNAKIFNLFLRFGFHGENKPGRLQSNATIYSMIAKVCMQDMHLS